MNTTTIGIVIAKSVFQLSVANQNGITERNRLTRGQFERFLFKQPTARLVMKPDSPTIGRGRPQLFLGPQPSRFLWLL